MKYPRKPRYPDRAQRDKWDKANLAAAKLILERPGAHPPFMREWAARCVARLEEERTGQKSFFASGGVPNGTRPDGASIDARPEGRT